MAPKPLVDPATEREGGPGMVREVEADVVSQQQSTQHVPMQETIVRLKVLSPDRTPEQITATVGLSCDSCWHIGDERAHTIIKEKTNGWVLGSGLPKTATLDEHIGALLSVLDARADSIRNLTTTSEVVLSCVVYADEIPALYFDQPVVNRLARLGASLDVDLYINESDVS